MRNLAFTLSLLAASFIALELSSCSSGGNGQTDTAGTDDAAGTENGGGTQGDGTNAARCTGTYEIKSSARSASLGAENSECSGDGKVFIRVDPDTGAWTAERQPYDSQCELAGAGDTATLALQGSFPENSAWYGGTFPGFDFELFVTDEYFFLFSDSDNASFIEAEGTCDGGPAEDRYVNGVWRMNYRVASGSINRDPGWIIFNSNGTFLSTYVFTARGLNEAIINGGAWELDSGDIRFRFTWDYDVGNGFFNDIQDAPWFEGRVTSGSGGFAVPLTIDTTERITIFREGAESPADTGAASGGAPELGVWDILFYNNEWVLARGWTVEFTVSELANIETQMQVNFNDLSCAETYSYQANNSEINGLGDVTGESLAGYCQNDTGIPPAGAGAYFPYPYAGVLDGIAGRVSMDFDEDILALDIWGARLFKIFAVRPGSYAPGGVDAEQALGVWTLRKIRSSMDYTINGTIDFRADGSFVEDFEGVTIEGTESGEGTWSVSGNTITLNYSSGGVWSAVILNGTGRVKFSQASGIDSIEMNR